MHEEPSRQTRWASELDVGTTSDSRGQLARGHRRCRSNPAWTAHPRSEQSQRRRHGRCIARRCDDLVLARAIRCASQGRCWDAEDSPCRLPNADRVTCGGRTADPPGRTHRPRFSGVPVEIQPMGVGAGTATAKGDRRSLRFSDDRPLRLYAAEVVEPVGIPTIGSTAATRRYVSYMHLPESTPSP